MSNRVAIIGAGPLPVYEGLSSMGPGIRTWQLCKPVLQAGFETLLVTFEFALPPDSGWDFSHPKYSSEIPGSLEHISLPEPEPDEYDRVVEDLRRRLEKFQPDAVISAGTFFAARLAASIDWPAPLWIDLFGHTMSEVQAKVARTGEQESEFFRFLFLSQMTVLRRGDHFSALSGPQKLAAIGELAMAGRINDKNLAHDLVSIIPCGFDSENRWSPKPGQPKVLRGVHADEKDFVILWTGGFNSWVDDETLAEGILRAMDREPCLRWVSLGGGIRGHFSKGYESFRSRAENSPHRERFVFLEWIPTEKVVDYFFESDIGINVDLPIYETLLGGRNRIVGWMAAGLPVITTELSEISREIQKHNLGFTVPLSHPEALCHELIEVSQRREDLPDIGRRARDYAFSRLTFEATTKDLLNWLNNPRLAPDRRKKLESGRAFLNSLDETLSHWLKDPEGPKQKNGWMQRMRRRMGF